MADEILKQGREVVGLVVSSMRNSCYPAKEEDLRRLMEEWNQLSHDISRRLGYLEGVSEMEHGNLDFTGVGV